MRATAPPNSFLNNILSGISSISAFEKNFSILAPQPKNIEIVGCPKHSKTSFLHDFHTENWRKCWNFPATADWNPGSLEPYNLPVTLGFGARRRRRKIGFLASQTGDWDPGHNPPTVINDLSRSAT